MFHRAEIEIVEKIADGPVQVDQAEEFPVSQPG